MKGCNQGFWDVFLEARSDCPCPVKATLFSSWSASFLRGFTGYPKYNLPNGNTNALGTPPPPPSWSSLDGVAALDNGLATLGCLFV